ncbi:hypothetical protein L1987_29789 [Smallanthus sonchifolius]|uniref:Uncharacterized protein n=1 Tax=Smallanthus sonchifolius TaxID=185202 RepID=A0ACB9I1K5_9ASTR|nr:hypothetical protein L1987_29789 [Smallanthus sonchifolius]
MYDGKVVILGVDDMDMFKGISLKFLAMGQMLKDKPGLRGSVVLVQIVNPARSRGSDIQVVENEMRKVAHEVNRQFGENGYDPIVFVNGPVSTQDKIAYYAISECGVVNAVRDGMNLVPYKYIVSRQGSPELDKALGICEPKDRKSVIIVSEFIGCSPFLSGAIRVNPWRVDSVTMAMISAIGMPDDKKRLKHEKHYNYISSHDIAYWAKSFDQDLNRACKGHFDKRCSGVGVGLGFRVVALGLNFRKLSVEQIVSSYKRTTNRLILLNYDGTVMPRASVDKSPSKEVVSMLNVLFNDPKNVVFIVSGRVKDSLTKCFDSFGQKPSMAEYYLDDTVDVINMLHGLELASSQVPKSAEIGVSFETSL